MIRRFVEKPRFIHQVIYSSRFFLSKTGRFRLSTLPCRRTEPFTCPFVIVEFTAQDIARACSHCR